MIAVLRNDLLHPSHPARCLAGIGIVLEADVKGRFMDEDVSDSLTYISFIVELEEKFDISIPDEYLQVNMLETYDDVADMIRQLLENQQKGGIVR